MNFDLVRTTEAAGTTVERARGDRLRRPLLLLMGIPALAMLAACTPYQPSGIRGGFSETATAPATEIVSFSSNELTSANRTKRMLLYRCAQVTRQNGYSYFIITGDNRGFQTAHNLPSGAFPIPNTAAPPPQAEVGVPGSMGDAFQNPLAAVPVTAGPLAVGPDAMAQRRINLEYEIKMFKGIKPANNPHAYYASDVFETVGPELGLPTS